MSREAVLIRAYRNELAQERLRRFGRTFGAMLCALGTSVLVVTSSAWALGANPAPVAGAGWMTAAILAALVAGARTPLGTSARRRVARVWDGRENARGAFLTATHLVESGEAGRLGPLVLLAADQRLQAGSAARPSAVPTRGLTWALGLVAISTLLLTLPPVRPGYVQAAVASALGLESGGRSAATADRPEDAQTDAPRTLLGDLVELKIATNRMAYLLEEEITVTATISTKSLLERDLELQLRLGVADGRPIPDQGLGMGFRPLDFPGVLELGREPGASAQKRLRLLRALKSWQIYRPGLYTLEARAILRSEDAQEFGAVVSNRVTIQVSENRERRRFRQPSPVKKEKRPDSPRKRRTKDKPKGTKGKGQPGSGEPDRLPNVVRKSHAVKPLLSDVPLTEKEVEVFEREHGGKKPPPAQAPGVGKTVPRPTFQQRPEETLERLRFSPLERQLIRRYFGVLRRGR